MQFGMVHMWRLLRRLERQFELAGDVMSRCAS
jgi:hypothetical protein